MVFTVDFNHVPTPSTATVVQSSSGGVSRAKKTIFPLLAWFFRRKRLIVTAIIVTVFFLTYQMLSVWQLIDSETMEAKSHRAKVEALVSMRKFGEHNIGKVIEDDDAQAALSSKGGINPEELRTQAKGQVDSPNPEDHAGNDQEKMFAKISRDKNGRELQPNQATSFDSSIVYGVLPKNYHYYNDWIKRRSRKIDEKEEATFSCLISGEQIPLSSVNDDYCDCTDFTDEPSTNACPENRFYCLNQKDVAHPISIPSSRVNDGICDCCDGSDEWQKISSPLVARPVAILAAAPFVPLSPQCPNRCAS